MSIHVGITYPPHRDEGVAEFHVSHEGVVDIPAEIFNSGGRMMIALYSRNEGIAWEYTLSDFLAAVAAGIEIIEQATR